MRRITSAVEIAASADRIWPFVAEFERWPQWGLSVNQVDSDARQVGPGVTGRVRTPLGFWVPFTIGEVIPGSFWDWSVAGVPATGHRLEPRGASTRVEFTAPWVVAPYKLVMALSLRKLKRVVEAS
ncbi:MAG: SRPBCC family protein [Acidimicrobiia bacterium]|nr:SRPBCC family protein [Acidimicrobiia bacterium]